MMKKKLITRNLILFMGVLFLVSCNASNEKTASKKPNIVVICLDDLGYGDISAYGATEINTPNIDALANGGIRFTDGHASSATCTPSRYAILTGQYPWRNKEAKILKGDAPMLINTAQKTLPKMLKSHGYKTGVVGKWHLGLGNGSVNWNKHITPSPNEVGFDYSYIMAATQDRVPTVFIKNGNVVGLDPNDPIEVNYKKKFEGEPNVKDNPELVEMKWHHGHNNAVINGIGRIGYMKGGEKARWKDVDMADHFLALAQDFIRSNKDSAFFLYYAMQQPHVPRTPHPRFVGKSGMGPRGDVILEADWCIGEFMKTLNEANILENTLIVFSSDNGPVLNDGYYDDAVEKLGKHKPAGELRGGKYSLFEAGTRVPFITYWKDTIQPGISHALICQMDLMASLEKMLNAKKTSNDSQDVMDVLLGKSNNARKDLILEAGGKTAYRKDNWLLIPQYNDPAINKKVNIETGNSTQIQLYNLKDDLAQQNNIADENKELVLQLLEEFKLIKGEN
jgi:arylsulfatase A-like enzyme